MSAELKLVIDPPLDGFSNMAVDDCLHAQAAQRSVLRLYQWERPTLSLGYFQSFDDPALKDPEFDSMPVVRRVTGGGAIVHADELTYSIALPADSELAGNGPKDLYLWMHDRVVDAVKILGGKTIYKGGNEKTSPRGGPFLCFARHASFDLMDSETAELKFTGSAQRRTRTSVVQHGSIILHRKCPVQPGTALDEILGRGVNFEEFAAALVQAVEKAGVKLTEPAAQSDLDSEEFLAACEKHASDSWLRLR